MHLEGILIHKTATKERDILAKVLLRSGKVVNLYFYGGRGGGKSGKGSILELGHMLKVTLSPQKKKLETTIHVVKEYSLLWEPAKIRLDFMAFYLLSFYCEIFLKIAVEEDLENQHDFAEHTGLFKVMSNAIYCLEDSLQKKQFVVFVQLFIFLSKLTLELGILPDYEQCLHCHIPLQEVQFARFEPNAGGFTCHDCLMQKGDFLSENQLLLEELKSSMSLRHNLITSLNCKFTDYQQITSITRGQCNAQFNYFCYQFSFQPNQFKTWVTLASLQ
jgi:recombinational DNA repair protein (RecF pathway)